MEIKDILQLLIFLALIIGLAPLLGKFMFSVFSDGKHFLKPALGGFENRIYGFLKINPGKEMDWKEYLFSILIFNFIGFIFLMLILMFQKFLPLNPQGFDNIPFHLAFNIAVSFVSNTNWQSYAGETTLSYLSQMLGLTVQNFLSAATGIAVLLAIARGLKNRQSSRLGNFYGDLVRSVIYILIPLSVLLAFALISQGVIQDFGDYKTITTLEGNEQIIPSGPAASQIAIKQLGTNGGGFFNTNSSHPFENPTPLSNLLQMLSILLIPASLTFTYGYIVGSKKQGVVHFALFRIYIRLWQ